MKENNGAFLISFVVIVLFIVFGVLGIKYLNFGVDDNIVKQYGVISKSVIASDDLEVWNRKDNLYIIYEGEYCGVVDTNSNIVVDAKYENCTITSNGFVVSKDNKYFLINRDNEIVLESDDKIVNSYDSYSEEDYYIVMSDKEKKIYNIEGKNTYTVLTKEDFYLYGDYIVFDENVTNYINGSTFRIDDCYGSGKYLIFDLYKSNGYLVYDFVNKKETKYTSLVENDYSMNFSNDTESLIIDYNGNVISDANVRKLNDNYSLDYSVCEYGFKVLNKDGSYVNDTCYSDINEDILDYGYLYLYDDVEELWTAIYSKNSLSFGKEDYTTGEFVVTFDDETSDYVLYDRKGNKKDYVCVNSFYEIGKDKYVCGDLFNYYIVDNEMNKLTKEYDSILCNEDNACIFRDSNGKYGLMINEVVVIEPSYYRAYIDDKYVVFEVVGGFEIYTLGMTEETISKEELKYEFSVNYGDLSTEDVIKEYSLDKIEDIIYDNEELFKEYAYIVLTNNRVNGYRRELLLMFDVIVDNKEYLNKEYFLLGVDRLQIDKTDSLEGTLYAGYYDNNEKKIELLVDDLNVINHELLHFIDSNINYELNSLMYQCGDEHYYLLDMKEFDEDKLSTCELDFFDFGNFVSEVGTEVNSARYTDSRIMAYSDATVIYHGLVYLLGEEYMEDIYFANDGEMQLYKKLSKHLSYKEYTNFVNALSDITNLDSKECRDDYVVVFDTLDKLYGEIIGGNWYEDNEYRFIMSLIYEETDISETVDLTDKESLLDVNTLLESLLLEINEEYIIATNNVGIFKLDGRTYLDISVWNDEKIVDLRIEYDFENSTVVNSGVI